jgi:hypothetical protein
MYAPVMHKSQGFDLEPVGEGEQFDALSFRECLDLGDWEYESSPVAGQTGDFCFWVNDRNQR